MFIQFRFWLKCTINVDTLPACKCQQCATLHLCWSIVNASRVKMCSCHSPKGVYQEILAVFPCTLSREQAVYCIRTLPRGGMYWIVHPRRPRDFPRPERCPEGEARGTSRGPFCHFLAHENGHFWRFHVPKNGTSSAPI